MNRVKLKLNPYKDLNIASLNDKPLSPYSELNNYMKEPFLKWADKLLDAIERELNDDYRLVLAGEEFETKFMQDMQNDFDSCISYEKENYQINYSVRERYEIIKQLADKYGVAIQADYYRMPVYTEIPAELPLDATVQGALENSALFITNNINKVNLASGGNGAKIIVLISDKSKVSSLGNMKYVWEIEEHRLSEVVNLITERFVKVPLIIDIAKRLEPKKDLMNSDDAEKLSLATEIDMFVTVEDMEDIEVGKSFEPVFKTLPANEALPALRIATSNSKVLSVEENTLKALAVGRVVVEFYKADEIIPFARKEVTTFQDNFVQKIQLAVTEKQMGIGKRQRISLALIPEDAEDAKQVKWSINNSEIADIQANGEIIAKSAGVVAITAETTKTKQTIEIEVLPNISNLSLSITNVELYVGQTQGVHVFASPSNCFNAEHEWKTSDKNVAIVEKIDDGSEIVRATGIGTCILTCKAVEGDCQASCNVKVESTFKKRENIHTWLSFTAVCTIVVMFCVGLSFAFGAIIAAVATIVCGVTAIGKNKSDRFWAFLLMLISIIIATVAIGM